MPRYFAWLGLSLLVIVLDQITKYAITHSMSFGQSVEITPFFDLVLVYNPGAAFSFLAHHDGWQRWLFTVLAIAVSGWLAVLLRRHCAERLLPLALALIIGGALGNVIDRMLLGAVIDFLYFHWGRHGFPAFNVADSAISVGVALMLWQQFSPGARHSAGASARETPQ
ncbi:MAG: lipoprotein signal peptidase [Sterolibacteriaceae bacterium]|nr:lipoprotein signal peptidase [Candidatus Methylophosphatis haderslevensis]